MNRQSLIPLYQSNNFNCRRSTRRPQVKAWLSPAPASAFNCTAQTASFENWRSESALVSCGHRAHMVIVGRAGASARCACRTCLSGRRRSAQIACIPYNQHGSCRRSQPRPHLSVIPAPANWHSTSAQTARLRCVDVGVAVAVGVCVDADESVCRCRHRTQLQLRRPGAASRRYCPIRRRCKGKSSRPSGHRVYQMKFLSELPSPMGCQSSAPFHHVSRS